jgi:hypothetical protein
LKSREVSYVRLRTEGLTYTQRCFRQSPITHTPQRAFAWQPAASLIFVTCSERQKVCAVHSRVPLSVATSSEMNFISPPAVNCRRTLLLPMDRVPYFQTRHGNKGEVVRCPASTSNRLVFQKELLIRLGVCFSSGSSIRTCPGAIEGRTGYVTLCILSTSRCC